MCSNRPIMRTSTRWFRESFLTICLLCVLIAVNLELCRAELLNPLGYDHCAKGSFHHDWMKTKSSFHCDKTSAASNSIRTQVVDERRRLASSYKVGLGDFPSFVQVISQQVEKGGKRSLCGGLLLNEFLVLTAAHCILKKSAVQVIGGSVEYDEQPLSKVSHASRYCEPNEYHTEQDKGRFTYNWAVLELEQDMNLNDQVQPGCVNLDFKLRDNISCVALGFDKRFLEKTDGGLQLKATPVVGTRCPGNIDRARKFGLMCVAPDGGSGGRDELCNSDAGGPLYCFENCSGGPRMYSVGVGYMVARNNNQCESALYTTTTGQRYQIGSIMKELTRIRKKRLDRRRRLVKMSDRHDVVKSQSTRCFSPYREIDRGHFEKRWSINDHEFFVEEWNNDLNEAKGQT